MKKTTIALGLLIAASCGFAQNKEIHFEKTTFADIKAKAKKENKLIFIDAYTSWCGPCKMMAKTTFTNDTVADYFNDKLINAKIDMEKGEGPEIGKLYDVHCYPNLLIIDGDGKLVHRGAGMKDAQQFIAFAKTAADPQKRFSRFTDEFAAKKTDPAFLLDYVEAMERSCLSGTEVLKDYFNTQKDDQLTNRMNWNAIREYSNDYKSREFTYVLTNIDAYKKLYTADSVENKVKGVLIDSGYPFIYKKDAKDEEYAAYINDIRKLRFSGMDEVLFTLDLAYLMKKAEWQKYTDLALAKGDKFYSTAEDFNNVSWNIYEHSDDKAALSKAEGWMQKAIKEQPGNWAYQDTYAAVLYKLKKKTEAKAAASKAIEIAKSEGANPEDYKPTSELLEQIEKL
ncbi:MAG: thioredoxin domain-containing protein [Bacteroidota bacterium]